MPSTILLLCLCFHVCKAYSRHTLFHIGRSRGCCAYVKAASHLACSSQKLTTSTGHLSATTFNCLMFCPHSCYPATQQGQLGSLLFLWQVFTVTTPVGPDVDEAAAFVQQLCPSARPTYALGGTQKYELPTSEVASLP